MPRTGAGSRLELAQVEVPDRLYETLRSGWPSRYWQPWRAYLEEGGGSGP